MRPAENATLAQKPLLGTDIISTIESMELERENYFRSHFRCSQPTSGLTTGTASHIGAIQNSKYPFDVFTPSF